MYDWDTYYYYMGLIEECQSEKRRLIEKRNNYSSLRNGLNNVKARLDGALSYYSNLNNSIKSALLIDGKIPCEGELNGNKNTVQSVRNEIDGTIGSVNNKINDINNRINELDGNISYYYQFI